MNDSIQCVSIKIPWTRKDVLLIFLYILFSALAVVLLTRILGVSQDVEYKVFVFIVPILEILITWGWLKKKYNISWQILGVRKGFFSYGSSFFIGAITAISMLLIIKIIPFWNDSVLNGEALQIDSFAVLLVPLTPLGFARFILGPFAEELLVRGFVFGYLKNRSSIVASHFLQASISTLMHPIYIKNSFEAGNASLISYIFIINIIFGILYERTNSINTSIVCHGLFNYLLFLHPV